MIFFKGITISTPKKWTKTPISTILKIHVIEDKRPDALFKHILKFYSVQRRVSNHIIELVENDCILLVYARPSFCHYIQRCWLVFCIRWGRLLIGPMLVVLSFQVELLEVPGFFVIWFVSFQGGRGNFIYLLFFFFIIFGERDSARYFQHMKVMVKGWLHKYVEYNLTYINVHHELKDLAQNSSKLQPTQIPYLASLL